MRVTKYSTPYNFPGAEFSEVKDERILVWSTATEPVDAREGGEYVTFAGKLKDGFNSDQTLVIDFQTLEVADFDVTTDPDDDEIKVYKEKAGTNEALIAWSNVEKPDAFEETVKVNGVELPASGETPTQAPTHYFENLTKRFLKIIPCSLIL